MSIVESVGCKVGKVMAVKVSQVSHNKAVQLQKFMKLYSANRVWGKDQKLLRSNLLLVPTSKNYTVLLAMGRDAELKKSSV